MGTRKQRCVLVVAPDPKPQAELEISGRRIRSYANKCDADYLVIRELPRVNHPCANKFILSQVAKLYEQTLLVDTDIIIQDHCPDVFELVPLDRWAMVDDLPRIKIRDSKWIEREWPVVCQCLGGEIPLTHGWNSGLCLAPRDAYREYSPPKAPVPDVWCIEQHILCYHLLRNPERIQTLPEVWQAGYVWTSFLSDIEIAYTIHINGCWHAPTRLAMLEHFDRGGGPIPDTMFRDTPKQYLPGWMRAIRQEELRRKIEARRARFEHLVDWARVYRLPTDIGLGDTVGRLQSQLEKRRPKSSTAQQLKTLLRLYACHRETAISHMNAARPYTTASLPAP